MAQAAAPNTQESQRLASLREGQEQNRRMQQRRSFLGNVVKGALLSDSMAGAGTNTDEQPQKTSQDSSATDQEAEQFQESQEQRRHGGLFAQAQTAARGSKHHEVTKSKAEIAAKTQAAAIKKRDAKNDLISTMTIGNPLTAIPWFNLQLLRGHMWKKGKDKNISPPSWRFLKIPLLPDSSARATIVLVDLMVAFVAFLMLVCVLFIIILVYAITSPAVMSDLVLGLLGSVSDFLYGFLPGL